MISVVIPVYNRRQWIGRAVRSVLEQSWAEREVIVVDDASDDGTPGEVAREFGDQVRLEVAARNGGVSAARNAGMALARGEWLAFLDSDDEWLPAKLEKQMAALEGTGLGICHTEEIWIRRGVRVNQHKHHQKYGGDIFLRALALCLMSPSAIVIHRDLFRQVGNWDESYPACEDYELFLRLTARHEVVFIDEPLIRKYGGHDDQLSRAYYAMDRFRVRALDGILHNCPELASHKREAARQMLLTKARIVHKGALKHDNGSLAEAMQGYIERWQKEGHLP